MKQLYLLLPLALAIGLSSQVKQSEVPQQGQQPSPEDHSISVKVLDAETGQPVKKIRVSLDSKPHVKQSLNAKTDSQDSKPHVKQSLNAKTDSHGVAWFHLSGPLPERVGPSVSPIEFRSCSDLEFVTDQILRTGIVGGNTCRGSKPKVSVTPEAGQLVVFGKRITWWQRVL